MRRKGAVGRRLSGIASWSALACLVAIGAPRVETQAEDWAQFLGPSRNGEYTGPLDVAWPEGQPRERWRRPVGEGFAGPAVAGTQLILFHRVDGQEVVSALDVRTGRERWRHAVPTTYRDDFGFDEGPRAVPVVADGRVFVFGAQGVLRAVDLETGALHWSVETHAQFGVRKGFFGAAGSPLVEQGRVIANIGGPDAGIVAFDAESGAVAWTATRHEASYSSGVAATIGGRRHALFLTRDGLVSLDPLTGGIRFTHPWRSRLRSSVNAATPLVVGDLVFISATYGTGAAVLCVDDAGVHELWGRDDVLSNHYATSVHHEGHLYGFHGRQEYSPSLRAVELHTGRVRWDVERFGAGTITRAGRRLVVMRESGELLIADATPEAFTPVARAQILSGVVRAYPALADGVLYVRNADTLVAVEVGGAASPR